MDKILKEAVDDIVEIFIIDVENVALAKGAVSRILKKLVEEKLTAHNSAMVQFTASQMHCAAKDAGLHGQDIDDLISAIGKQHQ